MDLVQLFVEAFADRTIHPDDLSLARRLLSHDDAEQIVAGLLRDHLGARGGDVAAEAAEARRAHNPAIEPPRPARPIHPSSAAADEAARRPNEPPHGHRARARRERT